MCSASETCATCSLDCGECPACPLAPSCSEAVGIPVNPTLRPDLDIGESLDAGPDASVPYALPGADGCGNAELILRISQITTYSPAAGRSTASSHRPTACRPKRRSPARRRTSETGSRTRSTRRARSSGARPACTRRAADDRQVRAPRHDERAHLGRASERREHPHGLGLGAPDRELALRRRGATAVEVSLRVLACYLIRSLDSSDPGAHVSSIHASANICILP